MNFPKSKKMTKTPIKFFFLLLIIIGLSNCGKGPQYYREASEQYSKGVALEMQERTQNSSDENVPELTTLYAVEGNPPTGAWEQYFDKAYEKVNLALQSKASLKKKDLLGNTLAIKALIEWQKEAYISADETALSAAKILANENVGYESTRDLTIMKAMPGLIAFDVVYDTSHVFNTVDDEARLALTQLSGEASAEFYKNTLQNFYKTFISGEIEGPYAIQKALDYVQQAKQYAGDNERLKKYLTLCQLAGHKTWRSVIVSSENSAKLAHLLPNRGPVDIWFKSNWTTYKKSRDEHLKMLEDILPAGKHDEVYKFFKELL